MHCRGGIAVHTLFWQICDDAQSLAVRQAVVWHCVMS